MAYISDKYNQQSSSDNLVQGAGGMAGQEGSVSGVQRTAAGSPGGWYNIQDFLSANQQTPEIRKRIEERGQQALGGAQQQYQQQVGGLQEAPNARDYSEDMFGSIMEGGVTGEEAQQLQSNIGQTFEGAEAGTQAYELAPEQQLQNVANPFESIKPGSFESLMGWYGNVERPSAEYTPGMQKMDEMLLRGQKGFTEEHPKQLQEQYQQTVAQPLQQKREEIGQKQQEARSSFENAGQNWTSGITSFIEGEKDKVNTTLQQQQQQQQELAGLTPYQQLQQAAGDKGSQYAGWAHEFAPQMPSPGREIDEFARQAGPLDYSQYLSRPASYTADPNRETAAYAALQDQGIQDYNTLAQVLGQAPEEFYTGEQYRAGEYQLDAPGYERAYQEKVDTYKTLAQKAEQAKIDKALADLAAQNFTLQPGQNYQDVVPSYLVPEEFEIARNYGAGGTNILGTGHAQAGQTVYAPWQIQQLLNSGRDSGNDWGRESAPSGGSYGEGEARGGTAV